MDRDNMSLAEEARAAIDSVRLDPGRARAIGADRVGAVRSRFLPYVVAGGAVSCGYVSLVVTTKDDVGLVYGSAVTAGIVVGMTVGWALLALYRRRVGRSGVGRRRADLAIVLLTVPAYVVAGWASAWVGWSVAVARSRPTPDPGSPDAWGLLAFGAAVIYPLSYVFARRDVNRPDDFAGALLAAKSEIQGAPRTRLVLWDFLIGLAWLIGALVVMFGVVMGVQVLIPDLQVADAAGAWLAVGWLLAWIGLTVIGTRWTVRWVHRHWPETS